MICLHCDNEEFEESYGNVTQEYKGRTFEVPTDLMVCKKCGWRTIGLDQADGLLANTKSVYNFELWWEENYSHMDPANYNGVLTKSIICVTRVVAKAAWLASDKQRTAEHADSKS